MDVYWGSPDTEIGVVPKDPRGLEGAGVIVDSKVAKALLSGALWVCVSFLSRAHADVWVTDGTTPNSLLGTSVASAMDVNGDGYSDVIVGAPGFGGDPAAGDRVLVFEGSAGGLHMLPDWTADSEQVGAFFGGAVAGAGDVNGDGFFDVIIGAPNYKVAGYEVGRVYVYLGSALGLGGTPAWTVTGSQTASEFGGFVSPAGDVNGDGYDDVILGAKQYVNPSGDRGKVWLFLGSASGLALTPSWTAESSDPLVHVGVSAGAAGDVDHDGYDDVVVGGSVHANGNRFGRAYLYKGSATGLGSSPGWMVQATQPDSNFGGAVGTAGDVNGDGYADVVVGAPDYFAAGGVSVYYGSATGPATTASWKVTSEQNNSHFGFSVGTAGDVNGDGYSDMIVGAFHYYYEWLQTPIGRAFVYQGGPAGLQPGPSWIALSDQTSTDFGLSVAGAGDTDHDGYADVIVGAPYYNQGLGRAYAFRGSAVGLGVFPAAGEVPQGADDPPLMVTKPAGTFRLRLSWSASCRSTDIDYSIYAGVLGSFSNHPPIVCSTTGATSWNVDFGMGSRYYLVVPQNEVHEGSYGRDSNGIERPQGSVYCRNQQYDSCP